MSDFKNDWYVPKFIPGINLSPEAFVRIPDFPNYEINLHGVVRHGKTLFIKTPSEKKLTINQTYKFVDLWSNNKPTRVGIHRLLALTFLKHPKDVSKLVINHKDGNGLNNHLDNLEWCTRRENNEHAIQTGLRRDNHNVVIRDLSSGNVLTFMSWHRAAEYMGVTGQALHWWGTHHPGEPYKGFDIVSHTKLSKNR